MISIYEEYLEKWNGKDLVPIDREELYKLVRDCPIDANLNFLDVSRIADMSDMFRDTIFNGQIGDWDVSNVNDMYLMFEYSKFNQPINDWDVSNVEYMRSMFEYSKFDQPIGDWTMSNINYIWSMFYKSEFKSKLINTNIPITEFVDKTELMITPDQLRDNIKIPLKQWCKDNWDIIVKNELYVNILSHYVYNHIDDDEKKFEMISKHNLTQFEI